jgi:hypothetical protein
MPSRQRAPQHARTPTRKARLDLWSHFLRRASRMCSCRPRRHGLAVAGCFTHAVIGEGALSSWSPSARLATGRSFLARVCADCGLLAHRHPWRRPELRRGSRRVAPFSANAEPKPCCSPCVRAHPSAHPRTRVHAPPHRKGHPHHLPSTAAAPTSPFPHRRRPRHDGHHPLVCVPSSPATQGAGCPGTMRFRRR